MTLLSNVHAMDVGGGSPAAEALNETGCLSPVQGVNPDASVAGRIPEMVRNAGRHIRIATGHEEAVSRRGLRNTTYANPTKRIA